MMILRRKLRKGGKQNQNKREKDIEKQTQRQNKDIEDKTRKNRLNPQAS